jgi:DNA repair protein RecO (recombination protein O)
MHWRNQGIVVAARRHGESSFLLRLLTEDYGLHAGLVRGGGGQRLAPVLQLGNLLEVEWRARLPEHLGHYTCDLADGIAGRALGDGQSLLILQSLAALVCQMVPERHPYPHLFAASLDVLQALPDSQQALALYARWELMLLAEMGFGLDLATCAATGAVEDLRYVSPKSARAVSGGAGEPWRDRLLPLPQFLQTANATFTPADTRAALQTTGHFLERHLLPPGNTNLPEARKRLVAGLKT